jgi:hypothetical protein
MAEVLRKAGGLLSVGLNLKAYYLLKLVNLIHLWRIYK